MLSTALSVPTQEAGTRPRQPKPITLATQVQKCTATEPHWHLGSSAPLAFQSLCSTKTAVCVWQMASHLGQVGFDHHGAWAVWAPVLPILLVRSIVAVPQVTTRPARRHTVAAPAVPTMYMEGPSRQQSCHPLHSCTYCQVKSHAGTHRLPTFSAGLSCEVATCQLPSHADATLAQPC